MRAFKFLVIFSCLISLVFSFSYVRENALNILDPIIQDHEAIESAEPKIQQITPEIPRYNLVQNKPISENSYINLPISLKIDDLEHLIRSIVPKNPIYKGEGKKGKTLTYNYDIFIEDNVTLSVLDNKMQINVPILAEAHAKKKICLGFWKKKKCYGKKMAEHADSKARIEAFIELELILKPDYTVHIPAQVNYHLKGHPHLKMDLFGDLIEININITDRIKDKIDKVIPDLTQKIQNKINTKIETLKIQQYVQKHWLELQKSHQIGDFWVTFLPSRVLFQGINQDQDQHNLSIGLGIEGQIQATLTELKPENRALPPLITIASFDPEFKTFIPIQLKYSDVDQFMNKKFSGKEYSNENYHIQILHVATQGYIDKNQTALLVTVQFTSRVNNDWNEFLPSSLAGSLYFIAVPAYDPVTREVFISSFEISSETNSALVDAGLSWLAFLGKQMMLDKLKFSLGHKIDHMRNSVNKKLNSGIKVPIGILKGDLISLNFKGIYLGRDGLDFYFNAEGNVFFNVNVSETIH